MEVEDPQQKELEVSVPTEGMEVVDETPTAEPTPEPVETQPTEEEPKLLTPIQDNAKLLVGVEEPEEKEAPPPDEGELNVKEEEVIPQQTERIQPSDEMSFTEFKKFLQGNVYRSKRKQPIQERVFRPSDLTPEETRSWAEGLIAGKKKMPTDPSVLVEIMEEMQKMRDNAIAQSDYLKAKHIGEVMEDMQTQYRVRDRSEFHKEHLDQIENRLKNAEAALKEVKETNKTQLVELRQLTKEETQALEERQQQEIRELEDEWREPKMLRHFNKRSPALLQNQVIEQQMVRTGSYEAAEKMKRLNRSTEEREAQDKHSEMVASFRLSLDNLVRTQEEERQNLQIYQDNRFNETIRAQDAEVAAKQARVDNLTRVRDEMKEFQNFIHRKYRRPADKVLPMTVITPHSPDLPSRPRTRSTTTRSVGSAQIRNPYRVAPLPLPDLDIKRARRPRSSFGR